MSAMTKYNRHLVRMDTALYEARQVFQRGGTLEDDRSVIEGLVKAFGEQIAALIEVSGGDPDYVESWPEKMVDDVGFCFMKAIEDRDDRRSNDSKAAYRADMERV